MRFFFGENNIVVFSLKLMMVTSFPLQSPLSAGCSRGLVYPSRTSAVFEEHCLLSLGSLKGAVVPAQEAAAKLLYPPRPEGQVRLFW